MKRKHWVRGGGGRAFWLEGLGNLSPRDLQVAATEAAKYILAVEAGVMSPEEAQELVIAAVKADRAWRKMLGE